MRHFALRELIQQPETAIRPFRRHARPPFSVAQLIVIALTMLGEASSDEAARWINQQFSLYQLPLQSQAVTDEFFDYDLPIKRVPSGDDETDAHPRWRLQSLAGARVFLRDLIGDRQSRPAEQPFDFLNLPDKLRNMIYNMVLCYPSNKLRIRRRSPHAPAHALIYTRRVVDKEHEDTRQLLRPGGRPWDTTIPDAVLRLPSLQQHLALLSTNRQISAEAIRSFFSGNTFVCSSVDELNDFLRLISPERRKCLRSLSIDCSYLGSFRHPWLIPNVQPFGMIKEMTELRHLTLFIDPPLESQEWYKLVISGGCDRSTVQFRDLELLTTLPGLEKVRLFGDCAKLASDWRAEVRKLGLNTSIDQFEMWTSKKPNPNLIRCLQQTASVKNSKRRF